MNLGRNRRKDPKGKRSELHIAYLTTEDLSAKSTSGKVHLRSLVRELLALGHRVTVIAPQYSSASLRLPEGADVVAYRVPSKNAAGLFCFELRLLVSAALAGKKSKPDVLLVRGGGPGWMMGLIFLIFRLRRVPVVLECNGLSWEEFHLRGFSRYVSAHVRFSAWQQARTANRIIGVSREITEEYRRLGGKETAQVLTIPNGVDVTDFSIDKQLRQASRTQQGYPPEVLVVGYVGSFAPWHGIRHVIDAARILQIEDISDIRFLLIGDGADRMTAQELIQQSGLRYVNIAGEVVARKELRRLTACFDVGLCTNIPAHGSPLKLFEYLAMGIPVLGSGFSQVERILSAHGAGIFLEDLTGLGIAEALKQIRENRQKWHDVGEANRLLAKSHSWQRVAEQVAAFAEF